MATEKGGLMELPPLGWIVTPDGKAVAVEAPPCGEALDVPARDVLLKCNMPKGHSDRHSQILILIDRPVYWISWCDGRCSAPCDHLEGVIAQLRRTGLEIILRGNDYPR